MYVSLKWIEQMLGISFLSLNFLTNRLILAGFEIESIKKKNKPKFDIILDISITANRSDSANIKGFLVELFSLINCNLVFYKPLTLKPLFFYSNSRTRRLRLPFLQDRNNNYKCLVETNNLSFYSISKHLLSKYALWEHYQQKKYFSQQNCFGNSNSILTSLKSYSAQVTNSPSWLTKRLKLMNFKPINNVIDTLNYILMETGQVFFAYDINSIIKSENLSALKISLTCAPSNTRLAISASETIILPNNILTICSDQNPLSVLGVIQDFNTLVTKDTSEFLLQTNLINPTEVKNSTKTLGLKTEYSAKLEKQIDIHLFEQAYFRLLYLFRTQRITASNSTSELLNFLSPSRNLVFLSTYLKQSKIKIFYKSIQNIVGPSPSLKEFHNLQIINNLKVLNFKIFHKTDKDFVVVAPLHRKYDIEQEIDVIEEVTRIIGFNFFPSLIPIQNNLGQLTKFEKFKRRIRTLFVNFGFHESLHSILSKKASNYQIFLKNPLFNDSSSLRVSLLNKLLEKNFYNRNLARESFETFEVGRVYKSSYNNQNNKKQELEFISGIFGGKLFRANWGKQSSIINWFEAKGLLENIFLKLAISIEYLPTNMESITLFHPTRTANIFIGSQMIGTFGQLNPVFSYNSGRPKQLYLFEFNIELLQKFWKSKTAIKYLPYSSYPVSYIDLSCVTPKSLSFKQIEQKILMLGQPLLKSIDLFDYYSKPPIKEGFCSLSFKLGFTSKTRTLLNTEVNKIVETIIEGLENNFEIEFN